MINIYYLLNRYNLKESIYLTEMASKLIFINKNVFKE